ARPSAPLFTDLIGYGDTQFPGVASTVVKPRRHLRNDVRECWQVICSPSGTLLRQLLQRAGVTPAQTLYFLTARFSFQLNAEAAIGDRIGETPNPSQGLRAEGVEPFGDPVIAGLNPDDDVAAMIEPGIENPAQRLAVIEKAVALIDQQGWPILLDNARQH